MKLAISSVFLLAGLLRQRSASVEGAKQELHLYFDEDAHRASAHGAWLTFDRSQPNLTTFLDLLPHVKSYCSIGFWQLFRDENFWGQYTAVGSRETDELQCAKLESHQAPSELKSIRHWGANDMSVDAVSLYYGDWFQGDELLIVGEAYAGISTQVKSLSASGNMEWTIFEGQRLNGKSHCISVPKESGNFFNYFGNIAYESSFDPDALNMTTIGSLYKGCDLRKIQEYRAEKNYLM